MSHLHWHRGVLPEIVWRNIRCMDPGFEDGGLGGIVYNIRQEKISG